MRRLLTALLVLATPAAAAPAMAQEVRVFAAGSLSAAVAELGQAFGGIAATHGPSGLLRERIEKGEAPDIFASANLGHPARIAAARGLPLMLFARNRMCAVARPGLALASATLLQSMLDPALRLGTSTPGADPSGDYAWAVFARAEAVRPGARAALEAKALQLVGGPGSAPIPPGVSSYGHHMRLGNADLFLSYCSGGAAVQADVPGATVIALPPDLAVGAEYGMVVLSEAPRAARFAQFVLSPPGQAILTRHGFEAPTAPTLERIAP